MPARSGARAGPWRSTPGLRSRSIMRTRHARTNERPTSSSGGALTRRSSRGYSPPPPAPASARPDSLGPPNWRHLPEWRSASQSSSNRQWRTPWRKPWWRRAGAGAVASPHHRPRPRLANPGGRCLCRMRTTFALHWAGRVTPAAAPKTRALVPPAGRRVTQACLRTGSVSQPQVLCVCSSRRSSTSPATASVGRRPTTATATQAATEGSRCWPVSTWRRWAW
mmetsp:Transcript_43365/g.107131  ORF Transcript_43365/g.107131 Transcript_43365/m.107131 type:complete len:223 (+) Transcript_43365:451-1119(+)